jgi:hypothetical protein
VATHRRLAIGAVQWNKADGFRVLIPDNTRQAVVMREALTLSPLDGRDSTSAEIMSAAFEAAWSLMGSSTRRLSPKQACDARVRLARFILERVEQGERDAIRLGRWAMASLNAEPRTSIRRYL